MNAKGLRSCWAAAFLVLSMQSLADIAREEAERRKLLEQQGIEGKVVEADRGELAPDGNITISSGHSAQKQASKRSDSAKDRTSARSYRTALQKLDRTIKQDEARLERLRTRLHDERWALPKVGRVSSRGQTTDAQNRLRREIEELQAKLKQMRLERAEVYDRGRKAGLLPGELDGKGIIP
jgi:seryl-tRNA synthetase